MLGFKVTAMYIGHSTEIGNHTSKITFKKHLGIKILDVYSDHSIIYLTPQ